MSGECWSGISEGDHSVEIEDLFQMGTLKELPYKDKDIEADDNEIDSRKILSTNSISNGNHNDTQINIISLSIEYKKHLISLPLVGLRLRGASVSERGGLALWSMLPYSIG